MLSNAAFEWLRDLTNNSKRFTNRETNSEIQNSRRQGIQDEPSSTERCPRRPVRFRERFEITGRSSLSALRLFLAVSISAFLTECFRRGVLFFDREDDPRRRASIAIDPASRTYHYWHVFVPRVLPGQLYGYRVRAGTIRRNGLTFDSTKVLLDPYGRGVVVPDNYSRDARAPGRRQRRDGDEERGGRSQRVRLGRRQSAASAVLAYHHLRDAT